MKILLLNDDYPPRGASSVGTIVEGLAKEYGERGHAVFILTSHRREENPGILRMGNVVSLPISYRASLRHYRCLRMGRVSRMIDEEIRRIQPTVVHAHNIHQYLTYDALRIARKHTDRIVITLHDVFSFSFARLSTAKYLSSLGEDAHMTWKDHVQSVGWEWNPLRNTRIRGAFRKNVRWVTVVSNALGRAAAQNGIENATLIYNGIDPAPWQCGEAAVNAFRAKHGLEGRRVLLFGGRLSVDKGAVELLHALECIRREIPSVLLLVMGDTERWQGLVEHAQVPQNLAAHWRCTGWLERPDVLCANYASDIAVIPSLCLDTFNMMNVEAMAARKPVVGTIFGGTPEVVVHGETGFVCDPRDIDTFAGYLKTLLQDDALRERMGEAGRQRAQEYFTLEKQAKEFLRLYQE
ncbi:hypothetical protein COU80_05815 [Candidatus Peregrinibacteria bacterium CG10_big_fil_rev_8_21_14_0_10_55_24]|nr:MAG: hypothetical protein COU80_05815 [Candidatus Peregrinibacteria bacterium CG10_big_fil_rev_8_21_14_0_10_55_24]